MSLPGDTPYDGTFQRERASLSGKSSHESDEGHTWQPHHERLVSRWALHAQYYQTMHSRAARHFRRKELWMGIPTTLLTTVTGTATFATWNGDSNINHIARILIGIMLMLTTILSALHNFLNYGALAIKHTQSAIMYESIYRDVEEILNYSRNKRSNVRAFVRSMKNAMRSLRHTSPEIPEYIMDKYLSDLDQVLQPDELMVTEEDDDDIPTPPLPIIPTSNVENPHTDPLPYHHHHSLYQPHSHQPHSHQPQSHQPPLRQSQLFLPETYVDIEHDELMDRMQQGVKERKRAIRKYQKKRHSHSDSESTQASKKRTPETKPVITSNTVNVTANTVTSNTVTAKQPFDVNKQVSALNTETEIKTTE